MNQKRGFLELEKPSESMDLSKMRADVQSALELMKQKWKELDSCLEGSETLGGNLSASINLRELKDEIALKEKEFEAKELERQKAFEQKQKMLNNRSLELDSKDDVLAIRRNLLVSEHEEFKKLEPELPLEEEKLKEAELILGLDRLIFEKESAETERKRNRNTMLESSEQNDADDEGAELGESSSQKRSRSRAQPSDAGFVRNDQQAMDAGEDGLMFLMTMSPSYKNYMNVPKDFHTAYDLGGKKNVILLTDEGSFRVGVKHRVSPSGTPVVSFIRGFGAFYRNNHISVGSRCLFKLKEHAVNGDTSTFSMEVSVFRR